MIKCNLNATLSHGASLLAALAGHYGSATLPLQGRPRPRGLDIETGKEARLLESCLISLMCNDEG